jgi:small subunit ribosomal protein S21
VGLPQVIIRDDARFERAPRFRERAPRFKKECEKAGILSDLRKHRHYEKPSEMTKRKMNAVRRKTRRPRPV